LASKFGAQAIPQGFPPFRWPIVDWAQIRDLLQPAMAIALLGAIESLLSAVVADGLAGDRHDSNTELIAQGISNLICPFFGGLRRPERLRGLRPISTMEQNHRLPESFTD
jgi:sulfate permease, SulP family